MDVAVGAEGLVATRASPREGPTRTVAHIAPHLAVATEELLVVGRRVTAVLAEALTAVLADHIRHLGVEVKRLATVLAVVGHLGKKGA